MNCSVIIPMYNAAAFIEKTLASIIAHNKNDIEIILVDDGSTDESADVASKYLVTRGFSSYRIITQENGGVSSARNAGLRAAKGEYIIFCDSDDELGCIATPDAQDKAMISLFDKIQDREKELVVWPFYEKQDGVMRLSTAGMDRRPKHTCQRDEFLRYHLYYGFKMRLGSFAVRRDVITKNSIWFDEGCTLGEDVEFFMKLLLSVKEVEVLDEPYYIYNKHSGSLAYSYNIRRFEAPLAMSRVAMWARELKSPIAEDIMEYISNGLFILHTMYAIQSCVANLGKNQGINTLWKEYISEYAPVESLLRSALRDMNRLPYGVSTKRLLVLKVSTKMYMRYLISIAKRCKP